MSLVGTVETVPLTDLLQLLAVSKRTGRLQVVQDRRATNLFIENGRLAACSADDPPKLLGHFLLYSGLITEEELRRSMAAQTASGAGLPKILVDMGAVTPGDLEQAVLAKSQETLLGLFDLERATFRFDEGVTHGPGEMRVDLDVADFILRGTKRIDDRKRARAALSPDAVPRKTDKRPPGDAWGSWPARQIYKAVDDERTVEAITILVHGTEFLVAECLLELVDAGLIEVDRRGSPAPGASAPIGAPAPKPAEPASEDSDRVSGRVMTALSRARGCLDAGDPEEALAILGDAHQADPTDSEVMRLLAEAEAALIVQVQRQGFTGDGIPIRVKLPTQTEPRQGPAKLTAAEEFVFELADGSMDVQSMIWVAPMRTIEVIRALRGLIKRGWIEVRPGEHEGE